MKACVDIGGTKVAVSLARPGSTELMAHLSEATAKEGANDAVGRQAVRLIEAACARQGIAPEAVDGVGVSAAGPFARGADGWVELAGPNICGGLAGPARGLPNDWTSARVEGPLRERFARVRVEIDAIAALEAERRWGALQGLDHCAYITWSTGIGVGLCVDGRALHGKHGNAGHAGHSFVDDDDSDALCGCGNRGDVEGLAAGNAIARRFGQPAQQLFEAAQAGDAQALARAEGLARVVGRMAYNLVVSLDLQGIALGGSVFWHNRDFLLPRLQAQVDGKLPALTAGVRLVPAGLGPQVGDYAALALAP